MLAWLSLKGDSFLFEMVWVVSEEKHRTRERCCGKWGRQDGAGSVLWGTGLPCRGPFHPYSPFTLPLFHNCVTINILRVHFGEDEYFLLNHFSKAFMTGVIGLYLYVFGALLSVTSYTLFMSSKTSKPACTRSKKGYYP